MKLIEIVKIANQGYNQGEDICDLTAYFDAEGQLVPSNDALGDTLALFVAREFHDIYDEDASDEDQLEEAVRVMERAAEDLDNIVAALRKAERTPQS